VAEQLDLIINKTAVYRLIGTQLAITIAIAISLLGLFSKVPAYSALLGGLAYILPNVYFFRCVLRDTAGKSPEMMVRWFYMGEAGKLFLTGLIFAVYFILIDPLNVASLFATFVVVMIVNLAGLALMGSN